MHKLTELIRQDMKPALGVTEPGAIAFAVSTARNHTSGPVEKIILHLNSGMYKNAFTCGIPGSSQVGNEYAAALGWIGADPDKGLECLEGITPDQEQQARKMIHEGRVEVIMSEITSRILIKAEAITTQNRAVVTIRDAHTHIVEITENGKVIFENFQNTAVRPDSESDEENLNSKSDQPLQDFSIHDYTLEDLYTYVSTVDPEEISFLNEAFEMNYALAMAGLESEKTTFSRYLLAQNGNQIISEDEQKTAALLCGAAIEARVLGLPQPAMSVTGSGAHGIIATMPLFAVAKVSGYNDETLLRATALSDLICIYIKEYSGKLSAFCGCAIAAGTGMACGLVLLHGGGLIQMKQTINNMASSITGMICDGGNQGCTMKGVMAVDAAWRAAKMALQGIYVFDVHGINGTTPEKTMYNMGKIASPGMIGTEKTIMDILNQKQKEKESRNA